MVWGGKIPSLEVFWEGASGEGWNEKRDGSPVLALWVGEQAFLWGGGSPGMGHGITRHGQTTKARLSEDGWRAVSRPGGCLSVPLPLLSQPSVKENLYFHYQRGSKLTLGPQCFPFSLFWFL